MRNRVRPLGWSIMSLILIGGGLALALDPPSLTGIPGSSSSKTAGADSKPATCKVEKGPFRATLALKGVFETDQTHEISFHPHGGPGTMVPGGLIVVSAASHGAAVKKGEVLVSLDTEKIDQAIKERRTDLALARLALKEAQDELPILERTLPLDQAAAERAKRHADEDYKQFMDVDLALSRESAEQMVKGATYRLEAAREELKQLEKMYRSKDLTEETEEYILKRHRQEVKDAEFYLKSAIIHRDETLKVALPRREVLLREATVKEDLALQKSKLESPLTLPRKKLALTKLQRDLRTSREQLAHLEQDREAMTIRAPADGIVYYGKESGGQWPASSLMETKLRKGATLLPDEVFMTVVTIRPLFVHATADEKDMHSLRRDLTGKAVPAGYPQLKIPARIVSMANIPNAPGKFDVRIALDLPKDAEAVVPGMACEVKLVTYHKDDALTVPAAAVFSGDDDDSHYVYLARKERKQPVTVGETNGERTVITEGLHAGEEILAAKPQSKQ